MFGILHIAKLTNWDIDINVEKFIERVEGNNVFSWVHVIHDYMLSSSLKKSSFCVEISINLWRCRWRVGLNENLQLFGRLRTIMALEGDNASFLLYYWLTCK
ncbi:unnamed protein product [Blepharisma stoltei]|uniref:Uncharacterized protein n=1 Tax=Blepharisma stoltei TaxID=1481888 RepID=A0AAU9IK31_9CILI|nr:unnamed protein product [Blepharisma stoltei]